MVRKRKGKTPKSNAKTLKVNNSKSGQNENQNNNNGKTTGEVKYNQTHATIDSVELIDVDELHSSTATQDLTRSSAVTNMHVTSGAAAHNAGSGASGWSRTALVEGTRAGKMPRPWFKKWGWWFLPLSLIGGALGAWWGVRHIERQVQAAAPEILKAAGVDPSGLIFEADYRNIAVAGDLPQGITVAEVEQILEQSTGAVNEDIRHAIVTARVAPLPAAEPEPAPEPEPEPEPIVVEPTGEISVTALSDGKSIRLSGSVPDQEHANRLFASAAEAVGEDNVVNELTVLGLAPSASEPETQINRLAKVLPQLGSGISAAELALGDETFSGSITAVDTDAKSQLDSIVATASDNEVTVSAPVAEPVTETPEVDVFADYQGKQIILYGQVINEAQSQTLFDAAAESVGAGNVVSTLKILRADNVPTTSDSQIELMGETLRQYNGLRSVKSRLNASTLSLRGVAKNSAAKFNVDQSLQNRADESLLVDSEITLLDIDSELSLLQQEFDLLAGEIRENIVFDSNSDVLGFQATGVLDKVINAIDKYDRARIEISGHTDSQGPAAGNQVLSARRASAVQAYLAANGIDAERLRALGFGESQPIGDNNTAAGRRQNRRVEFRAVESF